MLEQGITAMRSGTCLFFDKMIRPEFTANTFGFCIPSDSTIPLSENKDLVRFSVGLDPCWIKNLNKS